MAGDVDLAGGDYLRGKELYLLGANAADDAGSNVVGDLGI